MPHCLSTLIRLPPLVCRSVPSRESQPRRPHGPSIHILDDYSLLNIFNLYRPVLLDKDEDDQLLIIQGGKWDRERWWYKLAHVCRRWRLLIFGSPFYLDLRLVCTHGTPVVDMLAHFPPLPLILDYLNEEGKMTPEDEEGILLALQHRDRVRRIRLRMPAANLRKLIAAVDGVFPILEFLFIGSPTKHGTTLILPRTLQASHLLHIGLENFTFPIQSPLLMTLVGLTTLSLHNILPFAYFPPRELLQRLSLMPRLETLEISFHSPMASRHVEEMSHIPLTTHVILPNLRWFGFQGASAYLEALLPRITMPLLEKLQIVFFNQLTFVVPHLVQFIGAIENLKSRSAALWFQRHAVIMATSSHEGAKGHAFYMEVLCSHFDWQVAISAQIFNTLSPVFVAVDHLALGYQEHRPSFDWHNEADRTKWRDLLRSFSNVKTLLVGEGLIEELSRSLRQYHGEPPPEVLPMLRELVCYAKGSAGNTLLPFINDVGKASGVPVSLTVIPLPS